MLIPGRVNREEVLLLIDREGSMVPFHLLSERQVATLKAGRFGKVDIFYFHKSPREHLYLQPNRPEAEAISNLLPRLHSSRTVVLNFSDAGAARGGFSKDRVALTHEFLERLQPQVRKIAWLNPMPEERWRGTTAQPISRLVDMFEINRSGLKAAIRLVKSQK